MASRPETSRSRLAVALTVSFVLHTAVLLGFTLPHQKPEKAAPHLDTRVSLDGFQFSLINLDEPRRGKGAQEQQFQVHVSQELSRPFNDGGDPGPVVVKSGGPGGGKPGDGSKSGERGKGGGGTSFFRVPLQARRIVFALDCSLSMGLNRSFGRAREELLRCLHSLPETASFRVILYNNSAEPLLDEGERLLPVEPEALARVETALKETSPQGSTDHPQALQRALSFDPEVIFLVTDADDLTPPQVRDITRINRAHVVIHTVDVSRRLRAAGMLDELARQNGGMHVRAP